MRNHSRQWHSNEYLLQSYRLIFASSHTVLLAVGAIVFEQNKWILLAIAALALYAIWFIWLSVVVARQRAVDYHKYIFLHRANADTLCSEEQYINNSAERHLFNQQFAIQTNWRTTRKKIDLHLPLLYSALWAVLVLFRFFASPPGPCG